MVGHCHIFLVHKWHTKISVLDLFDDLLLGDQQKELDLLILNVVLGCVAGVFLQMSKVIFGVQVFDCVVVFLVDGSVRMLHNTQTSKLNY
jgi:hypothetical protein